MQIIINLVYCVNDESNKLSLVTRLRNSNNVYCMACDSCYCGSVDNVNNVYCYGNNAIKDAFVRDIKQTVYIYLYETGYSILINNVGNSVIEF